MNISDKTYSDKMNGLTLILCGSAPCLVDEFSLVRKHRPDAKIAGINEAIRRIKCDYLMTYHAEKVDSFLMRSLNKDIEVHTSNLMPFSNIEMSSKVDYIWKGIFLGATSAGDSLQIGLRMGFDEIIMVGCPMNGGDGYFYAPKATENVSGCPRFGNVNKDDSFIKSHQKKLVQLRDRPEIDKEKIFSMSGFSAHVFGKPNFKENDNEI